MRAPTTLLFAHHGTPGAGRAEQLAFELAVPGTTTVVHGLVVPDFWEGMQGDDWLNNASTRDAFARHLESQLELENAEQIRVLEEPCGQRGIAYRPLAMDPRLQLVHAMVLARNPTAPAMIGSPDRLDNVAGVRGVPCRPGGLCGQLAVPSMA